MMTDQTQIYRFSISIYKTTENVYYHLYLSTFLIE